MTILLVDDEPLVIQDIATSVSWKSLGINTVLLAYNASQAMQEFEHHHIDLIICDVEMPKINGFQLLEWVKEHSPSTQSIILTCHPLFDYAQKAIRMNCIDYMLKPIDTDALEQFLKNIMKDLRKISRSYNQELFWKHCADGTYSDNTNLPAVALQYGIPLQNTSYISVLIRSTTPDEYPKETDSQMGLLLNAVNQLFSDINENQYFFLDHTNTLFGIFSVSPDKISTISKLIFHRLEEARYNMPFCITALIQEAADLRFSVRSFSQLRNLSDQTTISSIILLAAKENSSKFYFSFSYDFYSKINDEDFLTEIKKQLSSLSPEPSRCQEALICMRRELENWFFTVLSNLGISPLESFQDSNIRFLRECAITSQSRFLIWVQALLACIIQEIHCGKQINRAVVLAQEYIQQNLQLNLSRKDVAKQVFLNADYLDRCFRNELGISISQYVLQKKLELAKDLLSHTNKSISDIASLVGYNNLSSFSYMFKHETGKSPMSYRQHKKDL